MSLFSQDLGMKKLSFEGWTFGENMARELVGVVA
jgi:hypothetical protein